MIIGKTRTNQPVESEDAGFKSAVAQAVSGAGVNNAKPIYCHPINISADIDENNDFDVSIFIFDNNETPYSWATFKQWLATLSGVITTVRVLTTGNIKIGGTRYPANYLFYTSTFRQLVVKPSGGGVESIVLDLALEWEELTPRYFNDGVNKIN